MFSPTVGTADAGEPAARIAAVQVALHYLLDNGAEEAVLFLEAMLILCEEAVEVMEEHAIKDSPLGMSGTINSGHIRSFSSRNGPARSKHALCPFASGRCSRRPRLIALESKQELTKARRRRQQLLS